MVVLFRRFTVVAAVPFRGPERFLRRRTVAILVVAVVTGASTGCTGDSTGDRSDVLPETTTTFPSSPAPIARDSVESAAGDESEEEQLFDEPPSYAITYRLDILDGERVLTNYERTEVVRPWSSRLARGDEEGAVDEVVELGAFGRRRIGAAQAIVLALPPTLAPADVRFGVFDEAVRLGVASIREERTLRGSTCRVVRTETGLASAALEPVDGDGDAVDSCVDDRGLVLEEATFSGGTLTRLRTAIETEAGIEPDPVVIEGSPAGVRDGGGSIVRLSDDSVLPGGMLAPADGAVPVGFVRRGRYAVVPPQAENFTDPTKEGNQTAGVADVWERGIDALVLDQGGTLRGGEPLPPIVEGAPTIDLGELGTAEVFVSFRMSELRVRRSGGRYVIVYGTLPPAALAEFARSLIEVPGGTLTPLPDAPL